MQWMPSILSFQEVKFDNITKRIQQLCDGSELISAEVIGYCGTIYSARARWQTQYILLEYAVGMTQYILNLPEHGC